MPDGVTTDFQSDICIEGIITLQLEEKNDTRIV